MQAKGTEGDWRTPGTLPAIPVPDAPLPDRQAVGSSG